MRLSSSVLVVRSAKSSSGEVVERSHFWVLCAVCGNAWDIDMEPDLCTCPDVDALCPPSMSLVTTEELDREDAVLLMRSRAGRERERAGEAVRGLLEELRA